MSVLICPVCQGQMKEINRNGVLIDTCTQCRGVWLDRGELEKLSAVVAAPQRGSFLGGAPQHPGDQRYRRDDDDDDDDRRYRTPHQGQRRKSFLDFFD
ncbi:MAG: zf-TFIIB domain-containing protein [Hyphomicrobiales bacterium]|nr:zf-TFIIB domain-containing protein [Hyphomicrobiales bacterium]